MNFDFQADAAAYWEARARRYACKGDGLAAVCSYGMPAFYNRSIHLCQFLALRPYLKMTRGRSVLDIGCGVGRWSICMAEQGAKVTGSDLSPTMVKEANRKARKAGVADRCKFQVTDIANLSTGEKYDFIIGVTVLQHILEDRRLESAVHNLRDHLGPAGRIILIEAAPTRLNARCDTPIFRARTEASYLKIFEACRLRTHCISGVDPTPLKPLLLPTFSKYPRFLALSALAVATAIALPVDILFGRRWVRASWHKLFVLGHEQEL